MGNDITVSDLDIMTGAVNYRRWLFGQVSTYLGKRVFEIGAGIGNYTEFLLDHECIVCLEIHAEAAARLCARFGHLPHMHIFQGDIADSSLRELAKYACDSAICFNVLEHVQDDVAALDNIAHILVPHARLLLIVPALPMIMGTVDRSLGHYRRYTRASLIRVLHAANYRIEKINYMNLPGIFGWWLNNRLFKRTEESPKQIQFYDRIIVPWVSTLEKIVQPPIGLSLVCVATSQDQKGTV